MVAWPLGQNHKAQHKPAEDTEIGYQRGDERRGCRHRAEFLSTLDSTSNLTPTPPQPESFFLFLPTSVPSFLTPS